MRFVIAADDDADVVTEIASFLSARGHTVTRLEKATWGQVALEVGRRVASGHDDQGVVLCFTGTGVSMAANRVPGVRAALCVDAETAAGARRWNDANVLALSLRLLTTTLAAEIMEAWLGTVYAGTEADSLAAMARIDATTTAPS